MFKNLIIALGLTPGRIIILLIMAGLIYLTYPQLASSAAPWLQPSNSSTAMAISAADLWRIEGLPFIVTPRPTLANTATSTLTPGPASIVVVTETPTPQNIITVAAQVARATAIATTIGTYTPLPFSWVVPIVVTPEPATAIPANTATATFQAAEATALAFVYGTATPAPVNLWTATPTPFMRPVSGEIATPWLPPTPTPTPLSIPQELVGKIIFLSNRSGGPQPLDEPLVYVINPDGSNLAVLTDDTFYKIALARDTYSADQRYRAFVKEFARYQPGVDKPDMVPAIFFYDYYYRVEEQITFFGSGLAWDPVWSPTREQIAFVSNDSQDDEIWIVNRDGSGLVRLTETNEAFNAREIGKNTFMAELNGHPSWSPDGSQIVFWSNRTRNRQIWVMDADGKNLRSLSTTRYDDWNPIWIKYTDPAREPVFGIGAEPTEAPGIESIYELLTPEPKIPTATSEPSMPEEREPPAPEGETPEPPTSEPPTSEPSTPEP